QPCSAMGGIYDQRALKSPIAVEPRSEPRPGDRQARLEVARETLRQAVLRQAQDEGVTENPQIPVTKIVHSVTENSPSVTINTPVTANPSPISVTLAKRKRGRPPTGKAQSAAERMRHYRKRKHAHNHP